MGNRVTKELIVPKKQHGGVYNDGWFGGGAAWSPDESRLAYVAEVSLPVPTTFPHQKFPVCCKHSCYFVTSLPRHSFMPAYEVCTNVHTKAGSPSPFCALCMQQSMTDRADECRHLQYLRRHHGAVLSKAPRAAARGTRGIWQLPRPGEGKANGRYPPTAPHACLPACLYVSSHFAPVSACHLDMPASLAVGILAVRPSFQPLRTCSRIYIQSVICCLCSKQNISV